MSVEEIWGELYEKNITRAETNMGLGFDSTVFEVSVCKACNGICHKELQPQNFISLSNTGEFKCDDHKNENL